MLKRSHIYHGDTRGLCALCELGIADHRLDLV